MLLIAGEDAKAKFPVAVTITDLISHGAMVSDYTITSYERTGIPEGKDYELELKTEDLVLFCVTMATLTRAAC